MTITRPHTAPARGGRPFDPEQLAAVAEAIEAMGLELSNDADTITTAWQAIAAEAAAQIAQGKAGDHPIAQVATTLTGSARALAAIRVALQRQAAAQRLPGWLPAEIRAGLVAMLPARLLPSITGGA